MFKIHNVVLLLLSVLIGQFIRQNPLLLGRSVGSANLPLNETFTVYTSHPVLDAILQHHKQEIGSADYDKYRNHCLRVLSFAGYYYRHSYTTKDKATASSTLPPWNDHILNVMALALAYHDIGLWTAGALDYLEPSVATMNRDFLLADTEESTISLPATFSDADLATARIMILQHHKYREWKKHPKFVEINEAAINAVRCGDWADATMGVIRTGLPTAYLEQAYTVIPEAGFHAMLAAMGGRLSPDSLVGQLDVLKILKW